jgi:hypothetical protein
MCPRCVLTKLKATKGRHGHYSDYGRPHPEITVGRGCRAVQVSALGLCMRRQPTFGSNCDRRPERWECIPEAVKAMPSVYSNLLTFITGAHACIGYRFAVME